MALTYAAEVLAACAASPSTCATVPGDYATVTAALAAGMTVVKVESGTHAGFSASTAAVIGGQYNDAAPATILVTFNSNITLAADVDLYNIQTSAVASGGLTVSAGASAATATNCKFQGYHTLGGSTQIVTILTTGTAAALTMTGCTVGVDSTPSIRILVDGANASLAISDLTLTDTSCVVGIRVANQATVTGSDLDTDNLACTYALQVMGTGGTVTLSNFSSVSAASSGSLTAIRTETETTGTITVTINGYAITPQGTTFTAVSALGGTVELHPYAAGTSSIIQSAGIALFAASGVTLRVYQTEIASCFYVLQNAGTTEIWGCNIHDCPGQTGGSFAGSLYSTGDLKLDLWRNPTTGTLHIAKVTDCGAGDFAGAGLNGTIHVAGSGALEIYGSRLVRCTSIAGSKGGAIYCNSSTTPIIGRYDAYAGGAGEGGNPSTAAWDKYDSGRVDQGGVEIRACEATDGGGIYLDTACAGATITNTRITGCNALQTSGGDGNGGGALLAINAADSVDVTLRACLIDNNTTQNGDGGGIHFVQTSTATGVLSLLKCTFDANDPGTGNGGHVYLGGDADAETDITDCIFRGAVGGYGAYEKATTSLKLKVSCLYQNTPDHANVSISATNIDADPLFCDADDEDPSLFKGYRIKSTSPCALSGTTGLSYGSADPFLDLVRGCSGIGCSAPPPTPSTPPIVREGRLTNTCDFDVPNVGGWEPCRTGTRLVQMFEPMPITVIAMITTVESSDN